MGASGMKKKQKDGERSGLWESGTLSPRSGWKSSSQTGGSWTEHVVAGGARRLTNVIAVAGTCSCIYALLIIFTSHPCWQSVSCRGPNCTPRQVSLTQASRRNIASQPGGSENSSIFKHPAQQQSEALRMRLESTSITPRSLPIGHALAVNPSTSTNLSHIVFGIAASSNLWDKRKEYTKLWWRPGKMRGFVWLDRGTKQRGWEDTLPPWKISGNISRFKYTNKQGRPSAIRISRIVSETFRLGLRDVHWFVMGDDDTVFIPENLVRVLSKYDHRQYYYIGSSSESHLQNIVFSYNMAYGGGGFAISYPLAKALEKMQDGCLQRYPGLFGSDDRIQACMAELGVPLTREPGFHQYDVYGNLFGLMATHPVTPVVSIHHLDVVEPIFPNRTRLEGLKHLSQAIKVDPAGFLQQSICYDKQKKWSISVSWGFAVQVVRGIFSPRELEMPSRTFYNWYKKADYTAYAFNTRPFYRHPCQKPFVFYMQDVSDGGSRGQVVSNYTREQTKPLECKWNMSSPSTIDWIKIVKELDRNMWTKAPRRKCCRVVSSSNTSMEIDVGVCGDGQIVAVE